MNIVIRRVLYSFMFLIFFLAATLVIFYATGYRFSIKSLQFVHVGALSVNSDPNNASIAIDGVKTNKTTPARILNLSPGRHLITVSQPGYDTWEKELLITAGTTTFVRNAMLFKSNSTRTLLSIGGSEVLRSDDASVYAFLDSASKIRITSTGTDKTHTIELPFKPSKLIAISPSKDYILLQGLDGLYALALNTEKFFALPHSLSINFAAAHWEYGNSSSVWILQKRQIRSYDVLNQELSPVLYSDIDDFYLTYNTVTTLVREKDITRIRNFTVRSQVSRWEKKVPSNESLEISHITDDTQVTLTGTDHVWIIDGVGSGSTRIFNAKYTSWLGSKMLYANDNEIFVYDAATQDEEFIDRSSQKILNILWFPTGWYFLRYRDDGIALVELDPRDHRNTVIVDHPNTQVVPLFDKTGSKLFLISPEANYLLPIR